jgi:hypothetical protein
MLFSALNTFRTVKVILHCRVIGILSARSNEFNYAITAGLNLSQHSLFFFPYLTGLELRSRSNAQKSVVLGGNLFCVEQSCAK